MGQALLAPPSVEGWQGAEEWVNTGSMMQRVNYAAKVLGDVSRPGVRRIVELASSVSDPEALVDACMEHLGYLQLDAETRQEIVDFAHGQLAESESLSESDRRSAMEQSVIAVLQLAVATREFQLA